MLTDDITSSEFTDMDSINNLQRLFRYTLTCCSLSLVVACTSMPEPVLNSSLIPASQKKEHLASLSKAQACPLHLASLTDERASKDLLVGSDSVTQDALFNLLKQSLLDMNVTPDIDTNNSVKVSLERAFVKTLGTNMVATVVIDVQYRPHNTNTYSPVVSYRGKGMQVNTKSAGIQGYDTVEVAIKEAIAQATRRLKSSLLHQCDEPAVNSNAV